MPDNARAVDADLTGFITAMFTETCLGREDRHPLEATIARYFHPDYQQRVDGRTLRYPEFVGQMRALRSRLAGGRVDVIEVVRQGHRLAGRHIVRHTTVNGDQVQGEVWFFGEFAADYRLLRMMEASYPVAPDGSGG
jgi:hypothetical protein